MAAGPLVGCSTSNMEPDFLPVGLAKSILTCYLHSPDAICARRSGGLPPVFIRRPCRVLETSSQEQPPGCPRHRLPPLPTNLAGLQQAARPTEVQRCDTHLGRVGIQPAFPASEKSQMSWSISRPHRLVNHTRESRVLGRARWAADIESHGLSYGLSHGWIVV